VKNRFQNLPFKCNLQRYTAARLLPSGERAALAATFAARLLPALLAAQRAAAAQEPVQRLLLRLVLSVLTHQTAWTPLSSPDFNGLLTLLGGAVQVRESSVDT
jgi:hypothetical protein